LVGVHDGMGMVLWVMYFLEAQGYITKPTTIHQDNMSTMLLANNGRASSSKRTRHLNIRYFFITDRIGRGEVRVKYCPTDDMIGDFYTKPLNGAKFRKFRNIIMNCNYVEGDDLSHVNSDGLLTPDIPNGKQNDSTQTLSYKEALGESQECVGTSRDSIKNDWQTVRRRQTVGKERATKKDSGIMVKRAHVKGRKQVRFKGTRGPSKATSE
jgi:hypothetical protein